MPSRAPIPTTQELIQAFHVAAGTRLQDADAHEGSIYDNIAGPSAVLFSRVAQRNRAVFRARYFDTAQGAELDTIIESRHADLDARALLKPGTGQVRLYRSTTGAETIWKGTRIAVSRGTGAALEFYEVSEDTAVAVSDALIIAPIQASRAGAVGEIAVSAGQVPTLRVEDPLASTWSVLSLTCTNGTEYEKDDELRSRVRQERFDLRPGYQTRIAQVCKDAGATVVAMFASDFLGAANDHGLNRIYVGDASFQTTDALLLAVRTALPSVVIAGTAVQALAMTPSVLGLDITVHLWGDPDKHGRAAAERLARQAVLSYFDSRANAFYWRESAILGSVLRAVEGVQQVDITPSVPEPDFATLFNTHPLPRFSVSEASVSVTVAGPA